jgi:hypothetical protein
VIFNLPDYRVIKAVDLPLGGRKAKVGWLATRSQAWRDRLQLVAIDPSAAF